MAPLHIDVGQIKDGRRLRGPATRLGRALGCSGALTATREFGDGKSNTRVVLVEHRRAPGAPVLARMVFKFGRGYVLVREVERYAALWPHIKATSVFAELLAPEATDAMLRDAIDDIGALAYRYVPDQLAVQEAAGSLEGIARDALAKGGDPPWPRACPARVAVALHGLLDMPRAAFGAELVEYYAGRWLPDLRAAVGRFDAGAGDPLLHSGAGDRARLRDALTEPDALRTWCRGGPALAELRRTGLEVIGWWGALYVRDHDAEVTMALAPEQACRDAVAALPRGSRVALWIEQAQVESTRAGVHAARALDAAPGWAADAAGVRLGQWTAPNPLRLGAEVLAADAPVMIGPSHGDLHPGNVFLAGDGPMFIDYGLAEDAPAGADVARLVGALLRNVVALALDPPALVEVAAVLVGLTDRATRPDAARALALVNPWREAWLIVAQTSPEVWARHLYGFALIGLKWTEGDGDDGRRHLACLLLAALAAHRLGVAMPKGAVIDPLAVAAPIGPAPGPLDAWRRQVARAHARVVPFFQPDAAPGDAPLLLDAVYVELAISAGPWGECDAPERGPRSLEALLAEAPGGQRRWLLLGDPGAGKSTLARHLTAKRAAEPTGEAPLCVYVPLAEWGASPLDVFDFVEARVARGEGERAAGLARGLRAAAEAGRLWLLLDGFDELAPRDVEPTVARIDALATDWPQLVVAVLSRPIGARRLPGFEAARLLPLDRARRWALLTRWLGPARGAKVLAEVEAHPALDAAAGNPLLLSLLAKVVAERGALPETRTGLFADAIELLLDRGYAVTPRGLGAHRDEARRLLRPLSLALTAAGGEAWAPEAVEAELSAIIAADRGAEQALARGWTTPAAFLADVARLTGVIGPHEGGEGRWRYLHRALRERLAAEALAAEGAEAIVARVRAVADDAALLGRWGETLGIACALLDDPRAPLEALRAADPALTVRALPELTGLPPRVALDVLWGIEPESGFAWDGDTLLALARRWPLGVAVNRLGERVEPGLDLDRLAFIHHALTTLGHPPDRAAFFARAGRPVDGVPTLPMVDIAAGRFLMGSPDDEEGRWDREEPRHPVTLTAPYQMGATPVTRAEYAAFDADHDCPGGPTHPVTRVSWWRAVLFAAWVGGALPTEAQWEYACRAGTTTRYWSGDAEADLERVGWYRANSGGHAQPVGEKPANPWGLYEMHGNVWEWCGDWFGAYPAEAVVDPSGPPAGVGCVVRGGSCFLTAPFTRSACRVSWHPGDRVITLGFRVVRAAPRGVPDS